MRRPMMPFRLLALVALITLSAVVCRANEPVTLTLRPAQDVAPQVAVGTGPQGQPAFEWIGHATAGGTESVEAVPPTVAVDTPPLLSIHTPAFAASDYVLRGRMKCDGVVGDARLDLMSDSGHEEGCPIPGWRFSGTHDWHDFEMTVQASIPVSGRLEETAPAEKVRKLLVFVQLPGSGRVTLSGPFTIQNVTLSNRKWRPEGAILAIPDSAVAVCPRAATATGPASEPAIEVTAGANTNLTVMDTGIFTVAISQNPAIASSDYVLRGRVKYEGVAGDGYLEMLNDFGDNKIFFSRSQGSSGLTAKITGTSDWRDFELPFHADPGMKPRRLILNVSLPGAGKVTVAEPLAVAELNLSGAWWTEQQAGSIGGILGCLGGLLGSLIGISAACRKFALTRICCGIGLAAGLASLIIGVVAVCLGQPWAVWYPLLLLGFVSMTVCGPLLAMVGRLSQVDELRRIDGFDAV